MFGTYLITSIRGVPIRLHFTSFFLLLILYNLVPSLWFALLYSTVILFCVTLHELGHTLIAQHYGLRVHDIMLTPLGGIARLSSNPDNPRHEIRMALGGPAVSFLLACAGGVIFYISVLLSLQYLFILSYIFTATNVMLLLFNLLPSFPMDGGRVLRAWLSIRKGSLEATRIATQVGKYFYVGFIVLGVLTGRLTLAFIGLMMLYFGGAEYRMMQLRAWQEGQLGEATVDSGGGEFVASPPPYATVKPKSFQPDGLLGDVLITFRDLFQEIQRGGFIR